MSMFCIAVQIRADVTDKTSSYPSPKIGGIDAFR
jgi:hypothetical protein